MAQMGGSIRRRQLAQRFNPKYSGMYRKMLSIWWLIAGQMRKTEYISSIAGKNNTRFWNIFLSAGQLVKLKHLNYVYKKSLGFKIVLYRKLLLCRNLSIVHHIRLYPCWVSRINKYSISVQRFGYIEPGAVREYTWSWSSVPVTRARSNSSLW